MSEFILVTGISGFLGSHVVDQLVKDGHRVRGTVRSAKVANNHARFSGIYGDKIEVVGVDDLIAGDFTEALKDIDAVIHVAAPLPGKMSAEEALNASVEGSLNVLRQGEKLGIKKFAVVSSIAAVANLRAITKVLTEEDWFNIPREAALAPGADPFLVYVVEKILQEKAVWEWAEAHPHVEVSTVCPPFFYGPFAPGYSNPDANIGSLSTDKFIFDLIRPDGAIPPHPSCVDVRDVAKGLIRSLKAPPTAEYGRRRFLLSPDEWLNPQEALKWIAEAHPELQERLSAIAKASPASSTSWMDTTRAKKTLGIEFIPLKKTVLDTVDSLLALEKEWAAKGLVAH